jgi:hypothetical protein
MIIPLTIINMIEFNGKMDINYKIKQLNSRLYFELYNKIIINYME